MGLGEGLGSPPLFMIKLAFATKTLNTPPEVMLAQARINLGSGVEVLQEQDGHDATAVLVGGGPSLAETLAGVAKDRDGGQVFALNGAHDYLVERGITPDYMVLLDARPENVRFVQKPQISTTYLVASQCHPDVFRALSGYRVIQWVADMDEVATLMNGRAKFSVGGGATVGMKAMYLAYIMGYRSFHLYGFDSSYRKNENHAYKQSLNDGEALIDVVAGGKTFRCAPWMAKQAVEFQGQARKLADMGCEVVVHGDGLLPHVASLMNTTTEAYYL